MQVLLQAEMLSWETERWMKCGRQEMRVVRPAQADVENKMGRTHSVQAEDLHSRKRDAKEHPAPCTRVQHFSSLRTAQSPGRDPCPPEQPGVGILGGAGCRSPLKLLQK